MAEIAGQLLGDSAQVWADMLNEWLGTAEETRRWLMKFGPWLSTQSYRVLHPPAWVVFHLLLLLMPIVYLVYETCTRYSGVQWARSNPVKPEVIEVMKDFVLPPEKLREEMSILRREIDKGLNPATKESSSVKCFNTYVQDLPTRKEKGKFLALDLGGSKFRILMVTLNGSSCLLKSKTFVISHEIMTGTGDGLFTYIAECLSDFVADNGLGKETLPLGFTFSFPLRQDGLMSGILQRWTKGFNCSGVVGQDVVLLLKNAIDKQTDLKIDLVAVLNDTTGTLMACAWKNPNTKIGVILGTGTNACYVEKVQNIPNFDGNRNKPLALVNTEWGAFGDNGELSFISTPYDVDVDQRSLNPGKQIHEKLISGMYLGEIVRVILVKMIRDNILFGGKMSEGIQQDGNFETESISVIEGEKIGQFRKCRSVLLKLGYASVSDEDCHSVRYVCSCVSRRAAHLASAGLAVLINKMAYSSLTIGVDGTLYKLHPHFRKTMAKKISELVDPNIMEFSLMLSSDGSGRGAGLVAAACSHNAQ